MRHVTSWDDSQVQIIVQLCTPWLDDVKMRSRHHGAFCDPQSGVRLLTRSWLWADHWIVACSLVKWDGSKNDAFKESVHMVCITHLHSCLTPYQKRDPTARTCKNAAVSATKYLTYCQGSRYLCTLTVARLPLMCWSLKDCQNRRYHTTSECQAMRFIVYAGQRNIWFFGLLFLFECIVKCVWPYLTTVAPYNLHLLKIECCPRELRTYLP